MKGKGKKDYYSNRTVMKDERKGKKGKKGEEKDCGQSVRRA